MKNRLVRKMLAYLMVSAIATTTVAGGMVMAPVTIMAEETGSIQASAEYTFDQNSTWDKKETMNNLTLTTSGVPAVGTTLQMDVLIPNDKTFSGILKPVGVLRTGSNWNWVQSNTIPELKAEDFSGEVTIGETTYKKASVSIDFGETVGANNSNGEWNESMAFTDVVTEAVSAVTVQFAGYQCNYSGTIAIANAKIVEPENTVGTSEVVKEWNFDAGIGSWENAGWDHQYTGTPVTVASEFGALKVNVDYSGAIDNSWSQIGVREWGDIDVIGTTQTTFDLYYDPAQLTKGALAIKEALQYKDGDNYKEAVATDVTVDTSLAVDSDIEGLADWKKVPVTITYDAVDKNICNTVLCIVGKNTTYSGAIYIDNLKMMKGAAVEDIYVDSTKTAVSANVAIAGNQLQSHKKDGGEESTSFISSAKLVDKDAVDNTKQIYAYLKAVGESESVIFGQQNNTWHKAGNSDLTNSDTMDVVGSVTGIVGIDVLSLTGNEYSAKRYNSELKKEDEVELPETVSGNVAAAAKLTNYNIEQGAIITLSAHMPNFSIVNKNDGYQEGIDPTYAKYDFSGYSPNTLSGDVMNEILPGGLYNEQFNAYLDLIADYAHQVDGTILFRPFHENTGSWFWWGKAFCDAATYRNVYKYTVEYLRDTKDVHNMLYVYGPGSEAASTEEYAERYPGDNYVDMVGFDMYHSNPKNDDNWFESFKTELNIVEDFANAHGKLIAVTETGAANSADPGDNQTALHKTGNEHKDWFKTMLDAVSDTSASYFLVWANFGKKDGFYTPYVESVNDNRTLHGHEMLDNFIDFYNDPRSLFANEQKDALTALNSISVTAGPVSVEADGYMTAPVSGKRILDATKCTANVSNAGDKTVKFVCVNGEKRVELTAEKSGTSNTYAAQLTKEALTSLGEGVGTIDLYVGETKVDSIKAIFNLPEPEKDPYEIDGFESYFGEKALLEKAWATNKDSGCTIDLSLTTDAGKHSEGDYALKFTYNEKVGGWAGATIAKEVDWSNCDALSFWTIPDGKNQKVVIQITAGGKEYEVYLNEYEEYKNVTTPLYVTVPFSAFKDRDGDGPEGGLVSLKNKIQSFGLWVNQIGEEAVEGTIYYDKITAVKSNKTSVTFGTSESDSSGGNNNTGNAGNGGNNNSGNAGNGGTINTGNAGNSGNSGSGNTNAGANTGSTDKPATDQPTTPTEPTTSTEVTTVTNSANKEVTVTTTTKTDETGKVTGVVEKSEIKDASGSASVVVTVKKDGEGVIKSAASSVSQVVKTGNKVSVSGAVVDQITEAAGTKDVAITVVVKDAKGNTKYKVKANAKDLVKGNKLAIYRLNTKTGEYEMVNAKTYTVNSKGTVEVSMTEKKVYELVSQAKAKELNQKIKATVKVAKTSLTVKNGKTATAKLSSGLNMNNVKKVTYASTKTSVAKVDKKGKITAKKKGTATIKVTVTLKNGTKKTVTTKVKVK